MCFAIMCLMAPVPTKTGTTSGMARMRRTVSGRLYKMKKRGARRANDLKSLWKSVDRLPTYALDNRKDYTTAQRAGSVALQSARFATLGLLGGSVGQVVTDLVSSALAAAGQSPSTAPGALRGIDARLAEAALAEAATLTSLGAGLASAVVDSVGAAADPQIGIGSSSLALSDYVLAEAESALSTGLTDVNALGAPGGAALDIADLAITRVLGIGRPDADLLLPLTQGQPPTIDAGTLADAIVAVEAALEQADLVFGIELDPTVLEYFASIAEPVARVPAFVVTAAAWALFLGVSTNLRYQLVCGVEQWLEGTPLADNRATLGATMTAVRLGNNVLGGVQFVQIAEFMRATLA